MVEKEGLLALSIFLCTTAAAIINTYLIAGIALLIAGLVVIFLRGYFKCNGRY